MQQGYYDIVQEILRVDGLQKHFVKKNLFGSTTHTLRAVDDVSFSVKKGEVFVLAGESGSGKSTIARIILHAIGADAGRITFAGAEISAENRNISEIRMQCQMVQQDPYDSINPRMRVGDIIAEPLEIHGIGDAASRRKMVLDALKQVRLEPADEIISKYPHMLSGGQRQRVVLARALAPGPKMIIADEPVSMLDVSVRAEMLELIDELRERLGITFLYITHDLATARYFGHSIAILYMGKIVESGPIDEVLLRPRHPYTQALIDAISEPDPENLHREKTIRIRREDPSIDAYEGCRFRPRCPYAIDECRREPETVRRDGRDVACFVDIG